MTGSDSSAWLLMCATNDEFVTNYNRLRTAKISFAIPVRSPFESLIDDATGYVPMPRNDPRELVAFMAFCNDLFLRLPADEPASTQPCFQPMSHQ